MLLTGGGTGGHVFPAIAVAEELRRRGWRVAYAGGADSVEQRLARRSGIPFHIVPASPFLGRGLPQRLLAAVRLALSTVRAVRLLGKLRAVAVLATGGYLSAPAVLAGALRRLPIVLLEPNAAAGMANRWLSRWARYAAVAYPDTAQALRCESVVTGVPVRAAFFTEAPLPSSPPWRILVMGGSLGARVLNEVVPEALRGLEPQLGALRVVHQAGAGKDAATRERYAGAGFDWKVVDFVDEVPECMADAHLLICRAGAITLAEICAAGRPSVLVPLAMALGHQRANAEALQRAGAAVVIAEDELSSGCLGERLRELFDRERLQRMADAARALAQPRAAEAIADLLGSAVSRA